jgi:acetyltransferase-like isoleucine patch superfamily enzyme
MCVLRDLDGNGHTLRVRVHSTYVPKSGLVAVEVGKGCRDVRLDLDLDIISGGGASLVMEDGTSENVSLRATVHNRASASRPEGSPWAAKISGDVRVEAGSRFRGTVRVLPGVQQPANYPWRVQF